jgi:FlaA1/EpsC-like NDP-sugar epimerase
LFEAYNYLNKEITFYPCDVSNIFELEKVFQIHNPDIIIHAAATKFVDWAEMYPSECVSNNIVGSKNLLDLAIKYQTKKIIAISTDKAAPPIKNIYGMTKAVMEKLYTLSSNAELQIACVRYGNVLWSTGSVLPVWHRMHQNNETIITTGPEMTRFFFSIDDAVNLIDYALQNISLTQGKILSQKMKVCKIENLLKAFCEHCGGNYAVGEVRPGERNYEVLIADTEYEYAQELDDKYILLHINSKKPCAKHLPYAYTTKNAGTYTHQELLELVKFNV